MNKFNALILYFDEVYMTAKPGVVHSNSHSNLLQIIDLSLLRLLTDEQLHKLESYVQFEKESRANRHQKQETVDISAVEARKGMKRSKSGGVELIFHNRSHTTGNSLFHQQESSQKKSNLDVLTTIAVDSEDLEVGSLFDNVPSLEARGTNSPMGTGNSNGSMRVISRSSGAFHPNDKMFGLSPNNTSSPGCVLNVNSVNSPALFLSGSPIADITSHSSRTPSRLGTNNIGTLEDASRSKKVVSGSSIANLKPIASVQRLDRQLAATVEVSLDANDAIALAGSLDNLILENRNREKLTVSPFSAFDDCSIGSHSINSSRSSKTRRMYEGSVELGSPTSHFSKRVSSSTAIAGMDNHFSKVDAHNRKHKKV